MKVLITGSSGQLGKALIEKIPKNIEIYAPKRSELNLSDIKSCKDIIKRLKPDWTINCGAFTNVNLAESQKEFAMRINAKAPEAFAKEIKKYGGSLLQISTDYVFDGIDRKVPYIIHDKRSPKSMYGLSKAKGEESVEKILGGTKKGYILRTSWLIGPYGENFIFKILKLIQEKNNIQVVSDQIGCPTSILSLAEVCWKIINLENKDSIFINNRNGILHWQDNGIASWFELASAINSVGKEIGLIKKNTKIIPIKTSEYKYIAPRPLYSVLDCNDTKKLLNIEGSYWLDNLRLILNRIINKR